MRAQDCLQNSEATDFTKWILRASERRLLSLAGVRVEVELKFRKQDSSPSLPRNPSQQLQRRMAPIHPHPIIFILYQSTVILIELNFLTLENRRSCFYLETWIVSVELSNVRRILMVVNSLYHII